MYIMIILFTIIPLILLPLIIFLVLLIMWIGTNITFLSYKLVRKNLFFLYILFTIIILVFVFRKAIIYLLALDIGKFWDFFIMFILVFFIREIFIYPVLKSVKTKYGVNKSTDTIDVSGDNVGSINTYLKLWVKLVFLLLLLMIFIIILIVLIVILFLG